MKLYTEREKDILLCNYFNKYSSSYTTEDIKNIKENFLKSYADHMTQIYAALGMMEDYENPYTGFTKLIEKLYGLDIDIIEVGGGIFPALSKEIAKRQESIGKGSITVIDPLLNRNIDSNGIILIPKKFNNNTNVSKYDLIIGKEPCAATETIIEKSRKKSLVISPCKCYDLLPSWFDWGNDPLKDWYKYVKGCVEEKNVDIDTYRLNELMHYDNPIYTKVLK